MSKKTLGKRRSRPSQQLAIMEELVAENQMATGGNSFSIVNEALGKHSDRLSPGEQLRLYKAMKSKYNRGVDLGYLKTILFPEYFKYDIPSPLTNLSYCKFDDKQDAIIGTQGSVATSTNISGTGMLLWFPRVTSGPSLFVWAGGVTTATGQGGVVPTTPGQFTPFGTGTTLDPTKWLTGFEQYYSNYFTQTQLVAASISVQYIGQQEQESGMWVGGHIFGQTPDQLTVDDIENSQYVTRARPNEGLRFVYLPAEGTDYEFYPTKIDNAHNGGAEPQGNEQTFSWAPLTTGVNKNLTGQPYTPMVPGTTTTVNSLASSITYMSNTNYVAIYWNGLPINQNWIRVDATRQFNGIPKQQYRNIVSVSRSKKNFSSKKTFDVLRGLCVTQASVGGHTLKDVDAQMDRIVEALPNVVDMVQNGDGMETTSGLGEFASALERPMSSANQKGLVGAIPQQSRRLYPYA